MSRLIRILVTTLFLFNFLQGCSTSTSDLRVYLADAEQSQISSPAMFVGTSQLVTASQESGGLYKLHHTATEVKIMVENVASKFGFESVNKDDATYVAELLYAFPDGGACENLGERAGSGAAFTASVLTFGIMPAAGTHCYYVSMALYERIGGELLKVGEFFSDKGRVDVYAGANEIESYSLIVTKRDEALGLETSVAALFSQMAKEGAFE